MKILPVCYSNITSRSKRELNNNSKRVMDIYQLLSLIYRREKLWCFIKSVRRKKDTFKKEQLFLSCYK